MEVCFRGPHRFRVEGALHACGTPSDSIVFTWDQPIAAHRWRGLRFVEADSTSRLEYCRIERVRSSPVYPDVRGGGVYAFLCSLTVRHCLIQENVSQNGNANGPSFRNGIVRGNSAAEGADVHIYTDSTVFDVDPLFADILFHLGVAGPGVPDGVPRLRIPLDNFPNPFNPTTTVRFDLPREGRVSLTVYDARGRRVRRLLDGTYLRSGPNSVLWDGRGDGGGELPSGVYFGRLEAPGRSGETTMLLIR